MSITPNLSLPYILPNQAQKHITHNEAILRLDSLVQLSVMTRGLSNPPDMPEEGQRFWVGPSAANEWSGQANTIAILQNGQWQFILPQIGWCLWIIDEGLLAVWSGEALVSITSGNMSSDVYGVNSEADLQNRLVVKSDAVLFSHDDVTPGSGDIQLKLNKSELLSSGSLLFQQNYQARAELGLLGNNHFTVKVSPDGAVFKTSQTIDTETGFIGVGTQDPMGPFHIKGEDKGLVLENTLAPSVRWSISPGRSGQYEGNLIIAHGDDINSGSHVLRLPADKAPTFLYGVSAEDGKSFSSHSSSALAYYKPFDGQKSEISFRGESESGAAELRLLGFYHDGSFNHQTIGSFTSQAEGPRMGIGTTTPRTSLDVRGLVQIGAYQSMELPSAAPDNEGAIAYVTDDIMGAVIVFSDGNTWRRMTDQTAI